jgi:D-beta-D-heptose 7-phosphate kinase/D-beta-D-heptose 1-phosphate adenosyltransferase
MDGKKMRFEDKKVVVIGDSILDETIVGDAVGVSLESPTLKIKEKSRSVSFGGAANVVEHLLALGASCTYITPLGVDEYSPYFDEWVRDNPTLWFAPLITDRRNNVKTRVWATKANERYKILQVNRTDNTEITNKMITLNRHIQDATAVVLVDYNLGMFGEIEYIIDAAQSKGIPVIASSQTSGNTSRYCLFSKADYLCMNKEEAVLHGKVFNGCRTMGDKGCTFHDKGKSRIHQGYKVKCVDPCGAGDAFLAAFSLHIDNVDSKALAFCNAWAALSTTKLGTATPKIGELNELFGSSFC